MPEIQMNDVVIEYAKTKYSTAVKRKAYWTKKLVNENMRENRYLAKIRPLNRIVFELEMFLWEYDCFGMIITPDCMVIYEKLAKEAEEVDLIPPPE